MSGRYWRGVPGETQLFFFLSLSLLCTYSIWSASGPVAGEAEFHSSVASSNLPTGHGARQRRVGEPQQSKRLAANELRADPRTT